MSNENKKDNLPGYPYYPAQDDITRSGNNNGRQMRDDLNDAVNPDNNEPGEDDITTTTSDTDADVTPEDLAILDAADHNMDTQDSASLMRSSLDSSDEDGDPLNEAGSITNDLSGQDLDVPGSGADDADELIGEEDEENNYYSLGGDLHESQEESKGD
jgi:hypothetical protein